MTEHVQPLVPPMGIPVKLTDYDPAYVSGMDKKDAQAQMSRLSEQLSGLQEKLYAQGKYALLVVLQAMDAGGKDGTIRRVFTGINPQGVRIANFKVPTALELSHDFLWRVHAQTPPKGYVGIFNRSHYEDVLIVRVNRLVPEMLWQKRYGHINDFERLLTDHGTRILKFFLHISKEEQKKRLQARLDDPTKRWKFSLGDLPVRQQWDQYMQAYEEVLTRCNTEYAPWHIVPANHKWYRNYVVMRTIVETLESMNLEFPPAEAGLDQVEIPD